MIVPEHWAEARLRERVADRQVTVRRFGWSDASVADAERHAADRAAEAMARIRAGETVPRHERKQVYGGAVGLPIREEVLGRYQSAVLTRNGYGAVCLNTPDVFIADIDFVPGLLPFYFCCFLGLLLLMAGGTLVVGRWQSAAVLAGVWVAAVGLGRVAELWARRTDRRERLARERIERFTADHPDWRLRVYRTPAGLRVLALHRPFDPHEPAVAECFRDLGTDPVYARMCNLQSCFRARVSPKPWRLGIAGHIRPRPGVWPVAERWRPARAAWVAEYERVAKGFAACRLLFETGDGPVHPTCEAVRRLHDELCRAASQLPLA